MVANDLSRLPTGSPLRQAGPSGLLPSWSRVEADLADFLGEEPAPLHDRAAVVRASSRLCPNLLTFETGEAWLKHKHNVYLCASRSRRKCARRHRARGTRPGTWSVAAEQSALFSLRGHAASCNGDESEV